MVISDVPDLVKMGKNLPPPRHRKSLRQNPFLHNVVEGRKDTLPHMALQRWVEVGNDLEGKKGRE